VATGRGLSNATTEAELARLLAPLVNQVAGAERASVWLWDLAMDVLRGMALAGYEGDVGDFFMGTEIDLGHTPELAKAIGDPQPRHYDPSSPDPFVRAMLAAGDSSGAYLFPIRSGLRFLGLVSADRAGQPPLALSEETQGRVAALTREAAQVLVQIRRQDQIRLHQLDRLTGLPNRALFRDSLDAAVTRARENGHRTALVFVDIDDFQTVNNRFGRLGGDQVLREVGRRLRGCVRQEDTLARGQGDEFALLLPRLRRSGDAVTVARNIRDAFEPPFEVGFDHVELSPSIGIAIYPDDGESGEVLLKASDLALLRIKAKGRGGYGFRIEA
jgi:diguanylate cyclase (GGDEF)-like protein